jgi:hypothetical protein
VALFTDQAILPYSNRMNEFMGLSNISPRALIISHRILSLAEKV